MKVSEIRIGNWLKTCTPNMEIMIPHLNAQVQAISLFGKLSFCHTPQREGFDMLSRHVQGIKLTEEWLLNFGFKYQDRDVNRKDGKRERFYISPYFGEHMEYWLEMNLPESTPFGRTFIWLNWDIGGGRRFVHLPYGQSLKYVHELQNTFFSLSNQDLTLKDNP